MTEPLMYHSPCLVRTIPDWPSGGHKVPAVFQIVQTKGAERCERTTQHPTKGTWSTPKKTTFARKARIVTGTDGRTYLLELGRYSNALTVMQGNLQYQQEYIGEDDPRHPALLALFQDPVPEPAPTPGADSDPGNPFVPCADCTVAICPRVRGRCPRLPILPPEDQERILCGAPGCTALVHLGFHTRLCPVCALDNGPYGT